MAYPATPHTLADARALVADTAEHSTIDVADLGHGVTLLPDPEMTVVDETDVMWAKVPHNGDAVWLTRVTDPYAVYCSGNGWGAWAALYWQGWEDCSRYPGRGPRHFLRREDAVAYLRDRVAERV